MAKRKIQDLLGDELQDSVSLLDTNKLTSSSSSSSQRKEAGAGTGTVSSTLKDSVCSGVQDSVSLELPKYQTLERKEVRFSAEQLDALTLITRRLNRTRRGKGERITDNTLIRVAVAALIDYSDQIQGVTEDEILENFRTVLEQRTRASSIND